MFPQIKCGLIKACRVQRFFFFLFQNCSHYLSHVCSNKQHYDISTVVWQHHINLLCVCVCVYRFSYGIYLSLSCVFLQVLAVFVGFVLCSSSQNSFATKSPKAATSSMNHQMSLTRPAVMWAVGYKYSQHCGTKRGELKQSSVVAECVLDIFRSNCSWWHRTSVISAAQPQAAVPTYS